MVYTKTICIIIALTLIMLLLARLYSARREYFFCFKFLDDYEKNSLIAGPQIFIGASIIKCQSTSDIEIGFAELVMAIGAVLMAIGIKAFMKEVYRKQF